MYVFHKEQQWNTSKILKNKLFLKLNHLVKVQFNNKPSFNELVIKTLRTGNTYANFKTLKTSQNLVNF